MRQVLGPTPGLLSETKVFMFLAYKNAIPMLDLVLVGGCDDLYDRLKIFT